MVIGANAAGLRAAARSKRLLPKAQVTVIDYGQFISYGACGMPYFVSGDIGSADKLRETAYGVIRDPELLQERKGSWSCDSNGGASGLTATRAK